MWQRRFNGLSLTCITSQKKKDLQINLQVLDSIGRGERIRTFDPYNPMVLHGSIFRNWRLVTDLRYSNQGNWYADYFATH